MRNFEEIRRKMVVRQDAETRSMFTGLTTNNATSQEPLTLDKIQRLSANMRREFGPTPMFLSSRLFPGDKAISVESATTKYSCAGPGFWARFQNEMRKDTYAPSALGNPLRAPMFGIQIHEIDYEDDDTPERRKYLQGIWSELTDAVKVAMMPLPDWLRRAPNATQND